jgi:hypothetical protein
LYCIGLGLMSEQREVQRKKGQEDEAKEKGQRLLRDKGRDRGYRCDAVQCMAGHFSCRGALLPVGSPIDLSRALSILPSLHPLGIACSGCFIVTSRHSSFRLLSRSEYPFATKQTPGRAGADADAVCEPQALGEDWVRTLEDPSTAFVRAARAV